MGDVPPRTAARLPTGRTSHTIRHASRPIILTAATPVQAVDPLDLDEAGQPDDRGGLHAVSERDRHARPPSGQAR